MHLTVQAAALRLGVATHTVRGWTASGLLSCTRTPGGHRRIREEDAEALAQQMGTATTWPPAGPASAREPAIRHPTGADGMARQDDTFRQVAAAPQQASLGKNSPPPAQGMVRRTTANVLSSKPPT
jgi:excisionase family DNA binding protein